MKDTLALKVPLFMNFRSAPRLVTLINHLAENLLGKTEKAIPSPKWESDQGECFVWLFKNPDDERKILHDAVSEWIAVDGVKPRDICILVKQKPGQYAGSLITFFNEQGTLARDESTFQDILTDELCLYIMHTLYCSFREISVESKTVAFSFLSNVNTQYEDAKLLKVENSFSQFVKKLKADFDPLLLDDEDFENMIQQIVNFAGRDRIKATYPEYKKPGAIDQSVKKLQDELQRSYANSDNLIQCLDKVAGKDTIPVMTVHKSKGLEYHTVIFLGLEDQAFWSFDKQPDEDKCTFFVALSRARERVVFTFSGLRKNKWDQMEQQNLSKIKILFTELENSGVAELEEISGT